MTRRLIMAAALWAVFLCPALAQNSVTFTAQPGPSGKSGNTILNGTTAPDASIGAAGDFYLNTTNTCLYGPRTNTGWPAPCVSLIGPKGSAGSQGIQGPPGPEGKQGVPGTISSGIMPPGSCTANDSRYAIDDSANTMTIYACDSTTGNAVMTSPVPLNRSGGY